MLRELDIDTVDHSPAHSSALREAKFERDLLRMGTVSLQYFDRPDPVDRARSAGFTAVWNGTCSATVDLARLAGPRESVLTAGDCARYRLPGEPPLRLSAPGVRIALYEHCLTAGTQFDIYRWINLDDLASHWRAMKLPDGVRREWEAVLTAAGLLDQSRARLVIESSDTAAVDAAPDHWAAA